MLGKLLLRGDLEPADLQSSVQLSQPILFKLVYLSFLKVKSLKPAVIPSVEQQRVWLVQCCLFKLYYDGIHLPMLHCGSFHFFHVTIVLTKFLHEG